MCDTSNGANGKTIQRDPLKTPEYEAGFGTSLLGFLRDDESLKSFDDRLILECENITEVIEIIEEGKARNFDVNSLEENYEKLAKGIEDFTQRMVKLDEEIKKLNEEKSRKLDEEIKKLDDEKSEKSGDDLKKLDDKIKKLNEGKFSGDLKKFDDKIKELAESKLELLKNKSKELASADSYFHERLFAIGGNTERYKKTMTGIDDELQEEIWRSILRDASHYTKLRDSHHEIIESIKRRKDDRDNKEQFEKNVFNAMHRHFAVIVLHYYPAIQQLHKQNPSSTK